MPMISYDIRHHGFYWVPCIFLKCVCLSYLGAGVHMNGYLEASGAVLNNVISLLREGSLMGTC